MDIAVGDIVTMKKSHPCGSNKFEVTRVGLDFKFSCCKCGHIIEGPRSKLEKKIKLVEKKI